jgi:hypothetical protein
MSDVALDCKVILPEAPPAGEAKPLNVGDIWGLNCAGSLPQPFTATAQIVFADEKDKLNLKILKVRRSDNLSHEFDVVSYKAGEFKDQKFMITDGQNIGRVSGLNYNITSVLKEDSKAVPPIGSEKMNYPIWLWVSMALFFVVIGLVVWRIFRRRKQRQELIEVVLGVGHENKSFREIIKIQNNQAYSQLCRDLRVVQKEMNAFKPKPAKDHWAALEKAFRYYLVRELLTPAFTWSTKLIIADVKKNHRKVYNAAHMHLRRALSEFDRASGKDLTAQDCEQVYILVRDASDKIYQARAK